MPNLDIIVDGEKCWPDLLAKIAAGQFVDAGSYVGVAALPQGMSSGATSVSFRFDLPDGTVVFAQTSLRLFLLAADMFRAAYPEEAQL